MSEKNKTLDELATERSELVTRNQEIDSLYAGQWIDPESEDGQEFDRNDKRIGEIAKAMRQQEARAARLAAYGVDSVDIDDGEDRDFQFVGTERGASFHTRPNGATRGEDIWDLSTVRASVSDPRQQGKELAERAMRAVDAAHISEIDQFDDAARSKGRVEALIRKTDSIDGRFSRYLLAVGSPTYKRAFVKYLATRDTSMMDRAEQSAWTGGQMAYRAMSLTGANGGFAVPFELDTTILNTNNGVINPIRQISRNRQITVDEWRGITSTGVTASFVAEASETTDNAPTLAQPTVSTERAHGWVPFSIEIGQDWGSIQDDMTELFRDAKDVLEAGKFVTGTGTNEPFGVMTGTTTTVPAATGLTITLANLYSLKNALPPRYRKNKTNTAWLGNVAVLDRFRQFDTVGSATAVWADGLQVDQPDKLLGYQVYEASEITGTITNATKVLVFGDFSRYLIVDRVGLTVDFIPHIFGTNQRPTGQRGLYFYWRVGAKVLDANAFRALVGTT
jgi:HK97 family phage major capsid protein